MLLAIVLIFYAIGFAVAAPRESDLVHRKRPSPANNPPKQVGISQGVLDNLSRYSEWAGAAYCRNNAEKPVSKSRGSRFLKCYTEADCPDVDQDHAEITWSREFKAGFWADLHMFVAVAPHRNEIVLAFRGTKGIADRLLNGELLWSRVDWCEHCKAHHGWWHAYMDVQKSILEDAGALIDQIKLHPQYKIVVVGHSIGGVFAQMAGIGIRRRLPEVAQDIDRYIAMDKGIDVAHKPVEVYSYGSPRFANDHFAQWITDQNYTNFRVTRSDDFAVRWPPEKFMGYYHASPEYFNSDPEHPFNPSNWQVVYGLTSNEGAASGNSLDHQKHEYYFGRKLTACM